MSAQLQVPESALVRWSCSRECLSFNCGSLIGLGDKILHQTYSAAPEKLTVECFSLNLIAMPSIHRSELLGLWSNLAREVLDQWEKWLVSGMLTGKGITLSTNFWLRKDPCWKSSLKALRCSLPTVKKPASGLRRQQKANRKSLQGWSAVWELDDICSVQRHFSK